MRLFSSAISCSVAFAAFVDPGAAHAQPAATQCQVNVVRAPEDVRRVIESWVRRETACRTSLDVRVIPTDDGLYLLARDPSGRMYERLVPDAQAAGVLVASWIAGDSAPPAPPPAASAEPTAPVAPAPVVAPVPVAPPLPVAPPPVVVIAPVPVAAPVAPIAVAPAGSVAPVSAPQVAAPPAIAPCLPEPGTPATPALAPAAPPTPAVVTQNEIAGVKRQAGGPEIGPRQFGIGLVAFAERGMSVRADVDLVRFRGLAAGLIVSGGYGKDEDMEGNAFHGKAMIGLSAEPRLGPLYLRLQAAAGGSWRHRFRDPDNGISSEGSFAIPVEVSAGAGFRIDDKWRVNVAPVITWTLKDNEDYPYWEDRQDAAEITMLAELRRDL